ncbi:MAG TPA: LLM class F420-dependent oxidoreductase [Jatrophihabitans sp.]|nr:LLM class F420-dependent oxidoreductase [Jatrophihabitans sp.]
MTTRFGIFVPQGWRMDLAYFDDPVAKWEAMTAVAKAADAGSWDSIWLYDHFHTVPVPTAEATFECWTTTAALARDTRRVNLGQMVGCNGYRNPALYAKMASTVDVASNGRLYAGIGAGWHEQEWRAYGYEWPELKDRMGAFGEAVQIIDGMWTQDAFEFKGKYYSVDKPYNEPKGVRTPHPSLWIGGGGEKVTLKLVAQYADATNVGDGDTEVIRRKLDVLRKHCETVGRDYDEIIKSTSLNVFPLAPGEEPRTAADERVRGGRSWEQFSDGMVIGDEQIAESIAAVIEAGIDYVLLYVPGVAYDLELVSRVEEITRQFC